jgi:exodeoxyribonuclease-3
MRIISWNCNGFRSVIKKDKNGEKIGNNDSTPNVITSIINELKPDIICLQEVKCNQNNINDFLVYQNEYPYIYVNYSTIKKGYSGVAVMSKIQPIQVYNNFDKFTEKQLNTSYKQYNFNNEGRVILLEFHKFFLVTTHTPKRKQKVDRLDERIHIREQLYSK